MKQIVYYVLFFCLFSSGILKLTEESDQWGTAITLLLVLIFLLFGVRGYLKVNLISFVVVLIYVFLTGISAIKNTNFILLQGALLLFILTYVSSTAVNMFSSININKVIYRTMIISYILLVLPPFFLNGIDEIPFKGIFVNPNSQGIVSATIFTLMSSILLSHIERHIEKPNQKSVFYFKLLGYLSFLAFVFFQVVISGSRTSFLTCAIVFLAGMGYLFIYFIKQKKIVQFLLNSTFLAFIVSLAMALIIKFTSLSYYLNLVIVDKFDRKIDSGNVLANRGWIYTKTFKDSTLFGNGNSYFHDTFNIGSHNTFIHILGLNGWLPLGFFVLLIVILLIYAIKYAVRKSDDKYKYMPFSLCVCFITLSMAETSLMSISMIAMFFSVGSIMLSSKQRLNSFYNKTEVNHIEKYYKVINET